ncbi:DUF2306 domain-containing protein [Oceanospirillaceae bacterium]|jgi:uncharacterized membrane protein|nr:DUF2306 domain-containing protein [Oceanospirillaceae bacterium]|tara:strand:- start:1625 stop:2023 length:399 start_codon:yes stop_codon:yes gene_type:complete
MNLDLWYETLSFMHLGTMAPAFLMATFMMVTKKGTEVHKLIGRIYMVLMLFTAMVTLLMSAQVGPRLFNHFGFIHLLSVLVLYCVPSAYWAIKNGNVKRHKWSMIGLYIGGLIVAGGFTLMPGRMLGNVLFG